MIKKLFEKFIHWMDYGSPYKTEDGVIYYIVEGYKDGEGCHLEIDTKSLFKSKAFKRQIEAVKRLEQQYFNS